MLNRTNRTLSANTNRLNLGTRSFALATNVANGKSTLRARFQDGDSPRVAMPGSHDPSLMIHPVGVRIPGIPSSPQVEGVWPVGTGRSPEALALELAGWPCTVVRDPSGRDRRAGATEQAQAQAEALAQAKPEVNAALKASYAGPLYATCLITGSRGPKVAGRDKGFARFRVNSPVAAIVAAAGG